MLPSCFWFLPLAGAVLAQASTPASQCPGYRATNVLQGDSYLVADLVLIGNCSAYGRDISNLRLLVEYQTGKLASITFTPSTSMTDWSARHSPACPD